MENSNVLGVDGLQNDMLLEVRRRKDPLPLYEKDSTNMGGTSSLREDRQ